MKKFLLLLVLSTSISSAQWVQKTSCEKNAAIISNQAIEALTNLEYTMALGMAKAALLIDSDCGCAQLTLAAISSPYPKWGSQKSKLAAIDVSKLSEEEQTWHTYLMASREDRDAVAKIGASKLPNSPLINYLTTKSKDMNSFKSFAEEFPKNAASSYNMMSYGYLNGAFGETNKEMAMKYVKQAQQLHDGPNSYDSMAEHYATLGDYEKALELELKAVDFATFGSTYWRSAQTYRAKLNQAELSEKLMQMQRELQAAIMADDYKTYSKFEHPDIIHKTGDSNLNPFYVFDKSSFGGNDAIDWNNLDLNDMEVSYAPDMQTAVMTFYGSGSYVFKESKEKVIYSTRGSSVWVRTAMGWKIMHTSWAPNKGGNGIPQS